MQSQSNAMETMLWNQLSGELMGGRSWLYAAYLVCLFAVIIFRPERIRNLSMYRRACYLFVLALIAPSVLNLIISMLIGPLGMSGNFNRQSLTASGAVAQVLWQVLGAMPPIFFALSVLCALVSIIPKFVPPPDVEPFASPPYVPRAQASNPPTL